MHAGQFCLDETNVSESVNKIVDIFNGVETDKLEAAHLRRSLAKAGADLVEPKQRLLGTRMVYSKDADGNEFGSGREKTSYCYDIPVDSNVIRLLQNAPRAWQMVQESMKRWSKDPPLPGTTERHFMDLPDGYAWENHPMLGTPVARARMREACASLDAGKCAVVRLAFLLSYDGVDFCNPLGAYPLGAYHSTSLSLSFAKGFARGLNNIGVFSYTIINLEPGCRDQVPFIGLATVAFESDIRYWGPELVLSGPIDEPAKGSSFGASMRRLNDTACPVRCQLPAAGKSVTVGIMGWTVAVSADFMARNKLSFQRESASAWRPCSACDFDTRRTKDADGKPTFENDFGQPSSFVSNGVPLPHHMSKHVHMFTPCRYLCA